MLKRIHQFKAGDIVHFSGARFLIQADAQEAQGHRPRSAHLVTAHGPSDCAYAPGAWIDGDIVPGYYGPNDAPWVFQGNFNHHAFKVAGI